MNSVPAAWVSASGRRDYEELANVEREGFCHDLHISMDAPNPLGHAIQSTQDVLAGVILGRGIEQPRERFVDDVGLGRAGSPYRQLQELGDIPGQVDGDLGLHGAPRQAGPAPTLTCREQTSVDASGKPWKPTSGVKEPINMRSENQGGPRLQQA